MTTLSEYLQHQQTDEELQNLILHTLQACQSIANLLRSNPDNIHGKAIFTNSSGETQQKLDIIANDLIKKELIQHQCVFALSSEEENQAIAVNKEANYTISFDPLDGSYNVGVNINVGTIFSILPKNKDIQHSLLQEGNKQVAAGFTVYGASTTLVLAVRRQHISQCVICCFEPKAQTWVIKQYNPSIPQKKQELSANVANYYQWSTSIQNYVQSCINNQGYSFRYVGSMVVDINRIVHIGGVFLYPESIQTGKGKLRLLYEANPMAMIIESCNGIASNGQQAIMNIPPKSIHERTGVLLGSTQEIQKILTNE